MLHTIPSARPRKTQTTNRKLLKTYTPSSQFKLPLNNSREKLAHISPVRFYFLTSSPHAHRCPEPRCWPALGRRGRRAGPESGHSTPPTPPECPPRLAPQRQSCNIMKRSLLLSDGQCFSGHGKEPYTVLKEQKKPFHEKQFRETGGGTVQGDWRGWPVRSDISDSHRLCGAQVHNRPADSSSTAGAPQRRRCTALP